MTFFNISQYKHQNTKMHNFVASSDSYDFYHKDIKWENKKCGAQGPTCYVITK